MSTPAQAIIEAAYAKSTANDPGSLATDTEMLGELQRVFQGRYAVWAEAAGDAALSVMTATFSGVPATITIPTDTIDVVRLQVAGKPLSLAPTRDAFRSWTMAPAVYRNGYALTSCARVGDPVTGTVATLWIVDPPAAITALSSILDPRFPVRFHNLLIVELALYLDTKDEGRDATQHQKLQAEFEREAQVFQNVAPPNSTATAKPSGARGAS